MTGTPDPSRDERSACARERRHGSGLAWLCASLAAALSAPARGDGFRFEPTVVDPSLCVGQASGSDSAEEPAGQERATFGGADLVALEADLTGAFDFDGTELAILDVGVQWFVADGISVGVFGEGIYAAQDLDDALGGGGGVLLRWHFVREERFTVFGEIGCGAVWFTDRVPAGGSDFDFSPRASIGASIALGGSARLDARVGWFHLSNAQTSEGNPGVDALAVGLGLVFPF